MKQFREIIDATTLAYETTQNLFDQHMSVARHEPKTPTDNQSEAGASASWEMDDDLIKLSDWVIISIKTAIHLSTTYEM